MPKEYIEDALSPNLVSIIKEYMKIENVKIFKKNT